MQKNHILSNGSGRRWADPNDPVRKLGDRVNKYVNQGIFLTMNPSFENVHTFDDTHKHSQRKFDPHQFVSI